MSNLTFSAEVMLSRFRVDSPKAGGSLGEPEFITFVGGDHEGLERGKKDLIASGFVKEIGDRLELTEAGEKFLAENPPAKR